MRVRWINVVGISWDIVSALAEKYRQSIYNGIYAPSQELTHTCLQHYIHWLSRTY